ncbi:DUF2336 domain-containing protein [Roseibium aggregatum]|uniref:DUF2336 domain-containing protein n=1 Tax=Roseibium aggregatum TaxID=187304 RepID=A0A939EDE1_9HYPH|nr:DUF2336 domain-containing protein [Roseibium aggregatum]MBN9671132.1 DUF2336 domain-containing protein [Roseibium aggregatum]
MARNLLPLTEVEDRRRIAGLLASHPEIPDDLLEQIASDEDPLTAYPVLRYSPGLSVDLLLRRVETGPDSLRKAIANRSALPESVIDALCADADEGVIRILLGRDDIGLTSDHKAKLGRRSGLLAKIGPELASRDAIGTGSLVGRFLHLPAALKAEAVAEAEMASLVRQVRRPGSSSGRHRGGSQHRLTDGLVRQALAQNKPRFTELLSQALSLPRTLCDRLLNDDQADGLVVALKAIGLPATETTSILIRLFGDQLPLGDIRALRRFHRTLSLGAAETLVGQWMLAETDALPLSDARHAPQFQQGNPARERLAPSRSEEQAVAAFKKTAS